MKLRRARAGRREGTGLDTGAGQRRVRRVYAAVDHANAQFEAVQIRGQRKSRSGHDAPIQRTHGSTGGVDVVQVHFRAIPAHHVEDSAAHWCHLEARRGGHFGKAQTQGGQLGHGAEQIAPGRQRIESPRLGHNQPLLLQNAPFVNFEIVIQTFLDGLRNAQLQRLLNADLHHRFDTALDGCINACFQGFLDIFIDVLLDVEFGDPFELALDAFLDVLFYGFGAQEAADG